MDDGMLPMSVNVSGERDKTSCTSLSRSNLTQIVPIMTLVPIVATWKLAH